MRDGIPFSIDQCSVLSAGVGVAAGACQEGGGAGVHSPVCLLRCWFVVVGCPGDILSPTTASVASRSHHRAREWVGLSK